MLSLEETLHIGWHRTYVCQVELPPTKIIHQRVINNCIATPILTSFSEDFFCILLISCIYQFLPSAIAVVVVSQKKHD